MKYFAINEAEFKISAGTQLNVKIIESIFGPPVAAVVLHCRTLKYSMQIIFGKTLSIFEKNETYRPV